MLRKYLGGGMANLEQYFYEISAIFARGNATEHTYRPALKVLLESITPGLIATNEPTRIECGAPDFIVTDNEIPLGYVEAKDIDEPLNRIEKSEQLIRYRKSLRNLVLTDQLNFRWYYNGELRLQGSLGSVGEGGRTLVPNHSGFEEVGRLLQEFAASRAATVSNPKELAERLAGLARLINSTMKEAVERDGQRGPLRLQLDGLRQVLLPDLKPDQFSDIYAETIVYGLFAARCNVEGTHRFNRQTAAFNLPRTNPFLRRLFNQIAGAELDERLAWIVDDVADLLDRTDIAAVLSGFGRKTRRQDPVFHFYETFLTAYDPSMRETRGVYYTPEPVVSYIVRSVDKILRRDFLLQGGLANSGMIAPSSAGQAQDHRVLVLDPATGTGTFLHAVIAEIEREIKRTLGDGVWGGANGYVAQHLLPRIFGFELLMAAYTVAHMKLGLQLKESGYDIASDQRLGVYLTNSLEPSAAGGDQYQFVQWLVEEAMAASDIKNTRPVMVVLGNPPYSGHSANNGAWIRALLRGRDTQTNEHTHSYFHIDGHPLGERNPKWLNDDYVKFIRFAQRRIERTGSGVLAFITNHGFIDNPTFRGMRKALMETFDQIYVLDLHGNVKKKERSPDGSADQNVFDIKQGVAIGIFVRRAQRAADAISQVFHAHCWGAREVSQRSADGDEEVIAGKYHYLYENDVETTSWIEASPSEPFYSFLPRNPAIEAEFRSGWRLTRIFPVHVLGFQSHRDHFAVAFTEAEIVDRMEALRDSRVTEERLREQYRLKDNRDWKLAKARGYLQQDENWRSAVQLCSYRPFDNRWCYFSDLAMDYPRRELVDHVAGKDNLCLLSSRQQGTVGYRHSWITRLPANDCVVSTRSREANYVFPIYLYPLEGMLAVDNAGVGLGGRRANISAEFLSALSEKWALRWIDEGVGDLSETVGPEDVLAYVYGILSSTSYRARYTFMLKEDFPHIPIASVEAARGIVNVGRRLMHLHLLENVPPAEVRISGSGDRTVEYVKFVADATEEVGQIRINNTQAIGPIASEVWEYQVGGFEVVQKWLKERRGMQLSANDIQHFQTMTRSIEETLLCVAELDEIIEDAGGFPFAT